jgi:hypothetical protein
MIGDCCPGGIESVAEGVCKTLEAIVSKYRTERMIGITPTLSDRGVPAHNVWKRIKTEDFITFYDHIVTYAKIARQAWDAKTLKEEVAKWKELFGDKFPDAPEDKEIRSNVSSGGYTERNAPTIIGGGRFA